MSEDLRNLLGEWKALEAAATPGPWRRVTEPGTKNHALHDARDADIATDYEGVWYDKDDAEFIAMSRTVVPRLIAAVEAVLDRARMEQDDAEFAMTYAAQVDDGSMLVSQQARKQAWADAARAITAALLRGDSDE